MAKACAATSTRCAPSSASARSSKTTARPRFVAWFEPEHHIVRANAGFFVRRFASMRWSILTPGGDHPLGRRDADRGSGLRPGPMRPDGDPVEEVWKTYYASIFNPARLKTGTMIKEMPKKYWKNMPETALVAGLIAGAQNRESQMIDTARYRGRRQPRPRCRQRHSSRSMRCARRRLKAAQRCPLWKPATQTVFGEGPADAKLLFIGEQPGDQEDLAGRPFVGPAGQLFDSRDGGGRSRSFARLRLQRGQAFQVRAARQAAYPFQAQRLARSRRVAGGSSRSARSSNPPSRWRWARARRSRCSARW